MLTLPLGACSFCSVKTSYTYRVAWRSHISRVRSACRWETPLTTSTTQAPSISLLLALVPGDMAALPQGIRHTGDIDVGNHPYEERGYS